jgi:hypothetical protein
MLVVAVVVVQDLLEVLIQEELQLMVVVLVRILMEQTLKHIKVDMVMLELVVVEEVEEAPILQNLYTHRLYLMLLQVVMVVLVLLSSHILPN